MDFRHVEPKFRKIALVVQVLLMVILLLSAARSVQMILQSSEPPVESSVVPWTKGMGKWAICSSKSPLIDVEAVMGPREDEGRTTKIVKPTKRQSVPWAESKTMECNIFDLTKWERQGFYFCAETKDGTAVNSLVWSDNRWQFAAHQNPYDLHVLLLFQTKYIHDHGYRKETRESNQLSPSHYHGYSGNTWRPNNWCGGRQGKEGKGPSVLEIGARESTIVEYTTLGTIPQLFNTLASIGGSISIMTLIFSQIFPKKYPDGAVSKEYEARTWCFASERAKKKKKKEESTSQPVATQDVGAVRASRRLSGVPPLPQAPRPSVGAKPLLPGPPGM